MKKQALHLEWQVAKDDKEWNRLCATLLSSRMSSVQDDQHWQRSPKVVAVMLLLAVIGGWWCHVDRDRPQPAHAIGSGPVTSDIMRVRPPSDHWDISAIREPSDWWWMGDRQEMYDVRAAIQMGEPDDTLTLAVDTLEVHGDQAVARIVTTTAEGGPAYRQTRFYQRTATGWVQTTPDAALWGPVRSLETPFFIYHFRQHDAPAVLAVAPQIDELYTTLWRNVDLPIIPIPKKLVIEVSVTQPSGQAATRIRVRDRFIVPSPAVYLAPVALTDADLLAQSIALPLLTHVSAQASEHHSIGAVWQPLVSGLTLWQMWNSDLPLAAWRKNIVKWLYSDGPAVAPKQTFVLPDRYSALCGTHLLWMPSPVQLNLPLICSRPEWEEQSFPVWRLRNPPTHLDQLILLTSPDEYGSQSSSSYIPHPGQTVALATLIEYAVAAYGREHLPTLVAGLGRYESWETLLPVVYDVSSAEFEAGWQAYLTAHYNYSG